MKVALANALAIILALLLSSCGYRVGISEALASYQTISIPYVKNDQDGRMTSILIKTMTSQTGLVYERCGGDLILLVDLLEFEHDNIGYRYDRKKTGKLTHSIIPTETRLFVVAQVSLVEGSTGNCLAGPVKITADVDFDHTYEDTRDGINVFSLGQLTEYDEAYDAAFPPLYRRLSQKIADFLINI